MAVVRAANKADGSDSSSLIHVACEQRALAHTYFSSVMISLWPVNCHARRRARSLASELRVKGGGVKGQLELLSHHKAHRRSPDIGSAALIRFYSLCNTCGWKHDGPLHPSCS